MVRLFAKGANSLPIRRLPSTYGLIAAIFLVVILLEYSTPPAFVFGYLYTGAVLLAHRHLSRQQVIGVTLAAAALTLLNLVLPGLESHSLPTVANRLIAVVALLVAGYLSDRNRFYADEIARQQAHIQAQAQLASLREDFISTLTHDLKTPLLGAIETINSFCAQQFGAVNPTQRKVLAMMQRSHRSTLQLVETMLDVYRNDAEGLGLTLLPVELRSLLADTVTRLTQLALSRQIGIQFTPQGQTFCVSGDALQLQRVFENLLSNAINHAPRGTAVSVILETVGSEQQVQVCDRGPGIAAHELSHLFERFYQSYSHRQAKGSGLGLYLSRQIVEAHSGKIWAENRDPQGAVFYCRLPAMPVHERCEPVTDSSR
ncbi:MAG: HAMP domain-containing histidine kinase [Leptolyngbya sp. SIO4C1]|nr:HAMP domain-containing histidine kinase [Leptolyngbya sp. SIO4C1]